MRGIGKNILVTVVVLVAAWLILQLLGFHMALGTSIALSVVLTLVANLALRGFRR